MTKQETMAFMKKIKAHYQGFLIDDFIIDEWYKQLKPYEEKDVLEKFDEHLKGKMSAKPPMLHYITRFLKTPSQKKNESNDFLIRCPLCQKEMYLSQFDNYHYQKCLLIKSLIPILKKNGNDVTYEELDEYDYDKLDKVFEKYYDIKYSIGDCLAASDE